MKQDRRSHAVNFAFRMGLIAGLALFSGSPARAQSSDGLGSRAGITFGGRAMYSRPKGADGGNLSGGAQLRLHLTRVLAIEGSADYRRDRFNGTLVETTPVQASLLLYLFPTWPISPYLLGGAGWYYTHVNAPFESTQHRFGPHAGGGLEIFLHRHWSIDGSYRYLWIQDINSHDPRNPNNYSDRGYMLTAGLNYRF